MNEDAWLGAVRLDPSAGVFVVVAITKELDPDARGSRDLDRLGRSFLGAEPAGEDSAVPLCGREMDRRCRHQRRQDRVDSDEPAPRLRLMIGHASHRRRLAARRGLPKRVDNLRLRGKVKRVEHRCLQSRCERDRGCVKRVIVDDVVAGVPHGAVHAGERLLCHIEPARDRARRPVERGLQDAVIDASIDRPHPG